METNTLQNDHNGHTKTIAEWLPVLSEMLSQDALHSTKKKPLKSLAVPRTAEKFKPLTIAEMRADIEALKGKTVKSKIAPTTSTVSEMKKRWNSSVKVDKRISHTSEGQLKNNPVRKVLNFQPRQTMVPHPRPMNTETPKFPKPEARAKKSIHYLKAQENVRISGVYRIPETPVETKKVPKSRLTIANKENITTKRYSQVPTYNNANRKQFLPPKPLKRTVPLIRVPETPLSNDSWKSSCDASFLQKEKEINDVEEKEKALIEEITLENLAEVTPPVSTPFKEYRNVQEYFNNSSDLDNTLINDNTIMCFDKQSICKEVSDDIKEETVIASLCDLLNKATLTNNGEPRSELDILIEIKKETENSIRTQIKQLKYINSLIKNKASASTVKTLIQQVNMSKVLVVSNENLQITSPILCQHKEVLSPSYKIPKRSCLKRKVFHKSMPEMNKGNDMTTPKGNVTRAGSNRALDAYMKMKAQLDFLNTPVAKQQRPPAIPDTPALTSHNLQQQLDKLFNGS